MITRQEYMASSESLHHAYYLEIANASGVKFTDSSYIAKFRKALETDPHMNNIPLGLWDALALTMLQHNPNTRQTLKDRGDGYSMATGVCILKAAARDAAKAVQQ